MRYDNGLFPALVHPPTDAQEAGSRQARTPAGSQAAGPGGGLGKGLVRVPHQAGGQLGLSVCSTGQAGQGTPASNDWAAGASAHPLGYLHAPATLSCLPALSTHRMRTISRKSKRGAGVQPSEQPRGGWPAQHKAGHGLHKGICMNITPPEYKPHNFGQHFLRACGFHVGPPCLLGRITQARAVAALVTGNTQQRLGMRFESGRSTCPPIYRKACSFTSVCNGRPGPGRKRSRRQQKAGQ